MPEPNVPKKTIQLDTPFRKGEKVLTTRDLRGAPEGTVGKVKLINGLSDVSGGSPWLRYWVRFEDGSLLGHVDHQDLVRPDMLAAWHERVEAEARAAEEAANAAAAPAADVAAGGDSGGGSGIESMIPAALLERSKAAKARLLG